MRYPTRPDVPTASARGLDRRRIILSALAAVPTELGRQNRRADPQIISIASRIRDSVRAALMR